MFGNKKKKRILEDGISAEAVVLSVADTGVTVNDNPRVKLTLQVQPEGDAPFEATKKVTVSRVAIPSPGDRYWVRYDPADPSEVEFDDAKVAAVNAQAESSMAQAAAATVPADLAQNGILGRGALVDVQKNPTGQLVDCQLTLGIRLVDGTPSYRANTRISLSPENAEKMIPSQTLMSVRADPNNHQRVAVSLEDPTPSITIDDPAVVDPPARALREGVPCQLTLVQYGEQFLRLPTGEDLYAAKVSIVGEGNEFQVFLPVPDAAVGMLKPGAVFPAKRVPSEPNVVTVDWAAAGVQPGSAVIA
jgi:hypothetical protein